MDGIDSRIKKFVDEIVGNEALLEMLDTDAATEMLNWGIATATSLVEKTEGLDDMAADLVLLPRLKAVRQFMRQTGNWAAGKYVDPESLIPLRDKLLEQLRLIRDESAPLPTTEQMDALLNQAGIANSTPHQLVLELTQFIEDLS